MASFTRRLRRYYPRTYGSMSREDHVLRAGEDFQEVGYLISIIQSPSVWLVCQK